METERDRTRTRGLPPRTARALLALAGLVLLGTASFHATGLASVSESIAGSGASAFVQDVVPSLWLFYSWHLAALAAGCVWAAARGGPTARPLVVFVALVVTVDLAWLLATAGLFPGSALLALAAVCAVVAGVRWNTDRA